MRNPLSAIIQCADDITTGLEGYRDLDLSSASIPSDLLANIIDSAETISLCAEHQSRIIKDVLTMSKIDSGMLQISPTSFHVVDSIKSMLKMFERELRADDFSWKVVLHESFEKYGIEKVICDPSRVAQIFINILTNVSWNDDVM